MRSLYSIMSGGSADWTVRSEDKKTLTDEQLSKMYRPIKQPVTLRLDADVIA